MNDERRKEKRWDVEKIPQELKDLPIWVGFTFQLLAGKKAKKIPINIHTGKAAKCNDASTWCSFQDIIKRADMQALDAIGFAITSPYVGVDIDACVGVDGVSQDARVIIEQLSSYTEFSPSGTGIHIICKGALSCDRKFTALSKAMACVSYIEGYERYRMSDFAKWGAALSSALGYSEELFFQKYQESVEHKWEDTADESTLASRIRYLVESHGGEWVGSATVLLECIQPETGFDKSIPNNAKALGSELMRIAPVMRSVGIDISRSAKRESGTGRKVFVLKKIRDDLFEGFVNEGVNVCDHESDFCEHNDERPY